MKTNSKPVAVLISDIHFTLPTLELASTSLTLALNLAKRLSLPLVIAGDTLDGKALVQARCANRLISILSEYDGVNIYAISGNHDLVNEKSSETALDFLAPYCNLIKAPTNVEGLGWLIPYQTTSDALQHILASIPKHSRIIMHQGVSGAYMGHYVQDKTSLPPEAFANFRVISGLYLRRQDIKCGPLRKGAVGLFSYIGNPYTLTFAEAEDPEKGFQVLQDDGLLHPVSTSLRTHRVFKFSTEDLPDLKMQNVAADDLLWVKLRGPKSELNLIEKSRLGDLLFGHGNFRLEKIYTDAPTLVAATDTLTDIQILDKVIDATSESPEQKKTLKALWRSLL